MINIEEYNILFNDFSRKFDINSGFQLCTSNIIILPFLQYIQRRFLDKGISLNIFFIRKNRIKSGDFGIIEGVIDKSKIILIDSFIENLSSLFYVEKNLEILGKNIFYTYGIIFNKNLLKDTYGFNVKYFKLRDIEEDNFIGDFNKYSFISTLGYSNKNNLYNKVNSLIFRNIFISYSEDGYVSGYNKYTFKKEWSYLVGLKNINITDFLIINNYILFGANDGNIHKVNINNGEGSVVYYLGDNIENKLSYDKERNRIIVQVEYSSTKGKFGLLFIELEKFKIINEILFEDKLIKKGIIFLNNYYIADKKGNFFRVNLDTFSFKIIFEKLYNISTEFVFIHDKSQIVFGTYTGEIFSIDLITLKVIYNKINNLWIISTPLIDKGSIYIGSVDKKLYILDLDLNIKGYIQTEGRIFSSPILHDNKVLFGSNDSRIYIYDLLEIKSYYYQLAERIVIKPVILSDKEILVQDFNNNLYRIRSHLSSIY